MKTAVILAAGKGTKIWPYAVVRPKAMIPVANKPLIEYTIDVLEQLAFQRIIVAVGPGADRLENRLSSRSSVEIVRVDDKSEQGNNRTPGTARSLAVAAADVTDPYLVLYGDTLIGRKDIEKLIGNGSPACALVYPLGDESSRDWICCSVAEGKVIRIAGHPRGGFDHRFAAFTVSPDIHPYLEKNSGLFTEIQVGMMPPQEAYLEMSLAEYMKDGKVVRAVVGEDPFIDVDKPWHILMANSAMAAKICGALEENQIGAGATIDPSAFVGGKVKLGKGSRIGRGVIVDGNIVVGQNTVVDDGAILKGENVIGDGCYIGGYCCLGRQTSIGNRCNVNHCAEVQGLVMDGVYLYHYMEIFGIIGENADLGAGTVCGTLRFDDGDSTQSIKGRRETPRQYGNAVYLGDFCRTGVNAVIMPGRKVGAYGVVGAGVVLNEDVPDRTIVFTKQKLERRSWGPERYGW